MESGQPRSLHGGNMLSWLNPWEDMWVSLSMQGQVVNECMKESLCEGSGARVGEPVCCRRND